MRLVTSFLFILFFFLAILPSHLFAEEILFAHYPFDEGIGSTALDASGNNHHGTLEGPSWTTGRLDDGLQFDGSDDRVELGPIDISSSAMTLMAWIWIDSFTGTSSDGRIISKAESVQEDGHYWMLSTINSSGTKLRFRLKTNTTTTTLIGGDVSTGAWYHAAAVYDGSYMRIYLDGSEVASTPKTGSISTNNSISAWIGDQPPTEGTKPWNGIIDDLRIYQSALTQTEIQTAMNNGNAFPTVTLTAPTNNEQFSAGQSVLLTADASDSDGTIQVVEFYEGSNKIGESLSAPYQATWADPADGTYHITAKAIDNEGSFTISSPPHQIFVGNTQPQSWIHLSTDNGDLELPTPSGTQQTATLILDINGDNIDDFVVTDRNTQPSVVWYESSDTGSWQRRVIEPDRLAIEAGGHFTDIDGDNDLDIMFGGDGSSNQIWWWENPSPDFSSRWTRRLIKNSGANKQHDQMFGDFDGDGQDELASWNQNASQLLLFEIPPDPLNSGTWTSINIAQASAMHEGMAVEDVDGDGKVDIVGAGRWYKHTTGTSYTEYVVDTDQTFGRAAAGQFISGGYSELVFGPGDSSGDLKFYQYSGNDNWTSTLLKANVDHGHSLHTADFDGDGNLDIFCAEMRLNGGNSDAKSWIFYGDGNGNFTERVVSEGIGNHESRPGDLDGDGDIDILGKPYNWDAPRLDIWLNRGTGNQILSLDMWERHLIDGSIPQRGVFITYGDMDGDTNTDIIAGAYWWKNPGSPGGTWTRHTIGSPLNNMAAVHDFDKDGDLDILGTTGIGSSASNTFYWARNDSSGTFTLFDNIETGGTGDFLQGCLVDDSGSNAQVFLSWHNDGGGVQSLNVPDQPHITSWSFATESTTTQSEDLSLGDIDKDQDNDLLLGTVWLENNNGSWQPHTLGQVSDLHSGAMPDRNDLADIDGDGRLDAVIGLENGTSILWFKAPEDPTDSWTRNIIATVAGQGFSMDVADFDNDSDPDVVVGEHRGSGVNRVILFENQEGGSNWVSHLVDSDSTSTIDHHDGTQAVDIDKDGDLDIISIGWNNQKIWLYENLSANNGSSTPPVITSHPNDTTVLQGESATLTVTATGTATLNYQWQKDGIDIPYATSPSLQTWPVSLGDDGAVYRCLVTNQFGQAQSNNAEITVTPVTSSGTWWNDSWRYRIPITVNPDGFMRKEFPVITNINFTSLLSSIGASEEFNPDSIRVVEVSQNGGIILEDVVFQFDMADDFNPLTNAAGELTYLLHGTTGTTETRFFHIYFDTVEAGHAARTFAQYVLATDNLSHKGHESVKIDTQAATYYYHKAGGGFASLLDSRNNDWIGYKNEEGSAASGWYRGIPNAIYPEDMMHPGRTGCQSNLRHQGPIRLSIITTCGDWQSRWNIFPYSAEMVMSDADHEYWFQYEGTPGGSTETTDFITLSDSTTTTADSSFTADIDGSEWGFIGDADIATTFFAAHHQNDIESERFYRMDGSEDNGMIIFAFGRGSGTTRLLNTVPQKFTIGLLETKDYEAVSKHIQGIIEEVDVSIGSVQGLAQPSLDISEIYFGDVEPGEHNDQVVTLTNSGTADLTIGLVAQINEIAPPFYIINDTCSNQTLAPEESCTITIRFQPPDGNSYADSFDIPTNGYPPSLTIYLYSGFKKFPWPLIIPIITERP